MAISGCSSSNSASRLDSYPEIDAQSFSLNVTTESGTVEALLRQYITLEFSDYFKISETGSGQIDVIFISHDQENEYSKWQNSQLSMILRDPMGDVLWSGEYVYKGGWELSGFTVNSPAESARLVTKRLANKFKKDFKL